MDEPPDASSLGSARQAALVFALGWLLQAALALWLPLLADEAYYLSWSRKLALGYLDHPPAVALWTGLLPNHPRFASLWLLPLGWWLLADALRRLHVKDWAWLPAVVVFTPLGLSAGVLSTPDGPSVLCGCALIWAVVARRFVLTGALLGLSLYAKHTVVFALPGLVLALGWRHAAVALPVALLVSLPQLWWSSENEWLPWSFQSGRAFGRFGLPEALLGQLAVVTPGVALLAIMACKSAWRSHLKPLVLLFLPTLCLWLSLSLITRVEANWPALAWLTGAALVVATPHPKRRLALAWARGLTAAVAVTAFALALYLPQRLGPPRAGLSRCLPAGALVARRYQEMALLEYEGRAPGYLRAVGHRMSQYDRWGHGAPPCGFLYLGTAQALGQRCAGHIEAVELSGCVKEAVLCQCAPQKP